MVFRLALKSEIAANSDPVSCFCAQAEDGYSFSIDGLDPATAFFLVENQRAKQKLRNYLDNVPVSGSKGHKCEKQLSSRELLSDQALRMFLSTHDPEGARLLGLPDRQATPADLMDSSKLHRTLPLDMRPGTAGDLLMHFGESPLQPALAQMKAFQDQSVVLPLLSERGSGRRKGKRGSIALAARGKKADKLDRPAGRSGVETPPSGTSSAAEKGKRGLPGRFRKPVTTATMAMAIQQAVPLV